MTRLRLPMTLTTNYRLQPSPKPLSTSGTKPGCWWTGATGLTTSE